MPIKTVPIELSEDDVERFWSYVDKRGPDECWEWTGLLARGGYGHIRIDDHWLLAHRISEAIARKDPVAMFVCHACDNPICVNPKHLFVGTPQDNSDDMVKKGRSCTGTINPNSKLTRKEVADIRRAYMEGMSQSEIARDFGVTQTNVGLIVRGKSWQHIDRPYSDDAYHKRVSACHFGTRNGRAKLTERDVINIRHLYTKGATQRDLAEMFGITRTQISATLRGKAWAHIPLPYTMKQYRDIAERHYREGMACTKK